MLLLLLLLLYTSSVICKSGGQHPFKFRPLAPQSSPPEIVLRPRYAFHEGTIEKRRIIKRALPQVPFLSSVGGGFKIKQEWGKYATPTSRDSGNMPLQYAKQDILLPNMSDIETLKNLAYMSANSYLMPNHTNWYNLTDWHMHKPFGWEKQGLRGYVYADNENTTFIISVKGTTAQFLWGGGGPTAETDKKQDNLLFSCCCARVDFTWTTVCDCHQSGNLCGQDCLENSVSLRDGYYRVANDLLKEILNYNANASVWFLGHSLGGAISTLLGLAHGIPAVAFEAPGDMLPARRLHLPMPPGISFDDLPIFHVGHNADPIFTGECQGVSSSCYLAGYAMETKCHIGRRCIFDAKTKLGWTVDIRNHRINDVIDKLLATWNETVPACEPEPEDCKECELWKFV